MRSSRCSVTSLSLALNKDIVRFPLKPGSIKAKLPNMPSLAREERMNIQALIELLRVIFSDVDARPHDNGGSTTSNEHVAS